jgi:hypothetical protein
LLEAVSSLSGVNAQTGFAVAPAPFLPLLGAGAGAPAASVVAPVATGIVTICAKVDRVATMYAE